MKPQLNTKGRDQLTRHRRPDEEEFEDEDGRTHLAPSPIVEPLDALHEDALALPLPGRKKKKLSKTEEKRRATLRQELTQRALALFTAGLSTNEIAAELGVTTRTVTAWFITHRRMVAEGEIDKLLDETAVPIAAENLVHGLLVGDKDYTLETLKGRGKLKRHSEGDGKLAVELPALVVRFEVPQVAPGTPGTRVVTAAGSIHGTASQPKQLGDGSVVDAEIIEREVVGASK